MMSIKLSDNKVITLLIVALLLQVLLLLWHMEVISFGQPNKSEQQGVLAGKIKTVENLLKKRPLDSLIWENTKASENIYFHDSILTLSESTAKIELENGTQINLSENTLITIEPADKDRSNEIRIQFSQGNLKARNPYANATIETDNLTLNVKANSDIEIFKDDSGQVEILINKGEAKLKHNNKTIELRENELVQLSGKKANKTKLNKKLQWRSKSLLRKYTHGNSAIVELKWDGQATALTISKKGKIIKKIVLKNKQKSILTTLVQGNYRAKLSSGKGQSKNIEIQIWQAPLVQLLRPQPRNRRKIGKIEFLWTPHRKIQSYEVHLSGSQTKLNQESSVNKISLELKTEDDLQWSVWGVDQKGFRVPPKYKYPLFIRKNPFAPPKLNKPKLIKQKKLKKNTSFIDLFITPAWAKTIKQALFSWQAVNGAEIYYLEISTSEDFRNPLVQEKVLSQQFLWKSLDDDKIYYWRVAAGDQSGRMGVFTEPTLVELVLPKPKIKSNVALVKKVAAKPKIIPVKSPIQIKKSTLKPTPAKEKRKAEVVIKSKPREKIPEKPLFESLQISYQPGFGLKKYTEDGSTKANLLGLNLQSFAFFLKLNWSYDTQFNVFVKYSQNQFEPKPKSNFPFQPDIDTRQIQGQFYWSRNHSRWGWGFLIADLPDTERVSFEEITTTQKVTYGAVINGEFTFFSMNYFASLGLINNGEQFGGYTDHRWTTAVFSESLITGLEIEAYYLTSSNNKSLLADVYLIFAYQF